MVFYKLIEKAIFLTENCFFLFNIWRTKAIKKWVIKPLKPSENPYFL